MQRLPRIVLAAAVMVCLLVKASAQAPPRVAETDLAPGTWLVVRHPEAAPEHFPCDPVYRTYLFEDTTRSPKEGELVTCAGGSRAAWTRVSVDESGALETPADYAFATLEAPSADIYWLEVSGAARAYLNGDPVAGDPLRRGFGGMLVELREGQNALFVTGIDRSFRVRVRRPEHRLVIATEAMARPWLPRDTERGEWFFEMLPVVVLNASREPVDWLHLHHGSVRPGHPWFQQANIHEWNDGLCIEPRGLERVHLPLGLKVEVPVDLEFHTALVPIEVWTSDDDSESALRVDVEIPVGEPSGSRSAPRSTNTDQEETNPLPSTNASLDDTHSLGGRELYSIYGTRGCDVENARSRALALYDQYRFWMEFDDVITVLSDEEALEFDDMWRVTETPPLVLIHGNEDTNALLDKHGRRGDLPMRVRRSAVESDGQARTPEDAVCYFTYEVFPIGGWKGEAPMVEIAVVASTGERGDRLTPMFDWLPLAARGEPGSWRFEPEDLLGR